MSNRWLVRLSLVALATYCTGRAAAEEGEFRSGLQPGETTAAFQCRDVTGPNKGKSLCYV
jgi:hypothetical protein